MRHLETVLLADSGTPEDFVGVYTDGQVIWIDDGTQKYSDGHALIRKFREVARVAAQAEKQLLHHFDAFLEACYPRLHWERKRKKDTLNALEYIETTRLDMDKVWADFSSYLERTLIMGYDRVPIE